MFTNFAPSTDDRKSFFSSSSFALGNIRKRVFIWQVDFSNSPSCHQRVIHLSSTKITVFFYSFLDLFSTLNTSHSSSSLHQDAPIRAVILHDCPSEGHPNGATGRPIDLQIDKEPLGADRTTQFTPQSLVYNHKHSLPAADKLIFISPHSLFCHIRPEKGNNERRWA